MSVASLPPHLPEPFPAPQAYRRAYEFIALVDDVYHGAPQDWREIRIPPGLPAEAVYRRLPVNADFEYAGFLTKTRVRYAVGWDTGAHLLSCKPCTFHTHPTEHPHADLPSFKDLYSFLRYTHRRHVTVGRTLIWVFDKTVRTLAVVERLNAFEVRHQVEAIRKVGFEDYQEYALARIGCKLPRYLKAYQRVWPDLAEKTLGIRVTLMDRSLQGAGREG